MTRVFHPATTSGPRRFATIRVYLLAATAFSQFALVACGSGGDGGGVTPPVVPPPPAPVASIAISPDLLVLEEGESRQVSPVVRDAAGNTLTGRIVTWTTSDTAIANVSAGGLVAGLIEGDTVTITAASEGRTAVAKVVVRSLFFVATSYSLNIFHMCASRASGGVYCWGDNGRGQLGNPANVNAGARLLVSGGAGFVYAAAGDYHGCALNAAGAAFCWGDGSNGVLGNGQTASSPTPVAVNGGLQFTSIFGAERGSCALASSGAAYCWGSNFYGNLGLSTSAQVNAEPQPVTGGYRFTTLSMYYLHACGIELSGSARCWGRAGIGDGVASNSFRTTPTLVSGGLRFVAISAGGFHSCGVDTAGDAWCWGENSFSQLGDGGTTRAWAPVKVASSLKFLKIAANDKSSCAITTERDVYCWGENEVGQLGTGNVTRSITPVRVSGTLKFIDISSARNGTCGRTVQRRLACWGNNRYGELGAAPSVITTPTLVLRP